MHLNKTRALAETALISALSAILLLMGTFISVNTLFFTALAAYFIGYSINKYRLKYGGIQYVVCVLLDFFLNPDKLHWILYLCLGGYIFLSECVFQKWNRVQGDKKKMRVQLICNWVLFNIIYIPLILFFKTLLLGEEAVSGALGSSVLLWVLGQAGWFVYDRAYLVFCRTIRERRL